MVWFARRGLPVRLVVPVWAMTRKDYDVLLGALHAAGLQGRPRRKNRTTRGAARAPGNRRVVDDSRARIGSEVRPLMALGVVSLSPWLFLGDGVVAMEAFERRLLGRSPVLVITGRRPSSLAPGPFMGRGPTKCAVGVLAEVSRAALALVPHPRGAAVGIPYRPLKANAPRHVVGL